jgi:hypothetical protein
MSTEVGGARQAETRPAAAERIEQPGGGWLLFAGIMVVVAGVLNIIYGIAAIDNATFFINDAKFGGGVVSAGDGRIHGELVNTAVGSPKMLPGVAVGQRVQVPEQLHARRACELVSGGLDVVDQEAGNDRIGLE